MSLRVYCTHIRGEDRKKILRDIFEQNPPISEIKGLLTARILDPILDCYPDMTVKEFLGLNHQDLLVLRGFGRKALQLVREFVKEIDDLNGKIQPREPETRESEIDERDMEPNFDVEMEFGGHAAFTEPTVRCAWSGYTTKDGIRVPACQNRIPVSKKKMYCCQKCSLSMFCKYMAEEMSWAAKHLYGIEDWELPITIEQFATIILEKQSSRDTMEEICGENKIDLKKALLVINHPIVRMKFPKVFANPDPFLDKQNTIDNKMAEYLAKDKRNKFTKITNEQLSAAFGIPLYKIVQRLGENDERKETGPEGNATSNWKPQPRGL